MSQPLGNKQIRVGGFETVAQADRVIRQLLVAGFSKDQLIVICPGKFLKHLRSKAPLATTPSPDAGEVIAEGSLIGATLGGLALAATVLTGGAAAGVAAVFIGGGAIAGGISSLIVSKGYEEEVDDSSKMAVQKGLIVVGVVVSTVNGPSQVEESERILNEAGAMVLEPAP